MSRWTGVWSMEFVRLCSLARAALEKLGVKDPSRHLFAASKLPLATLLVKRTPFTMAELRRLHEVSKEREFGVLYSPAGGYTKNPASIWPSSTRSSRWTCGRSTTSGRSSSMR